jgi:spore coat polysaccharide biosynthesis protein SpsF
MPIGTAVDAIDPDVLAELATVGETHPVKLPRANPEQWNVVWNDNTTWHTVSDAHIAVDTPADYWSLTDAQNAVGDDPFAVAEWLTENAQGNNRIEQEN